MACQDAEFVAETNTVNRASGEVQFAKCLLDAFNFYLHSAMELMG